MLRHRAKHKIANSDGTYVVCLGGAMLRALDLRSGGREFDSLLLRIRVRPSSESRSLTPAS